MAFEASRAHLPHVHLPPSLHHTIHRPGEAGQTIPELYPVPKPHLSPSRLDPKCQPSPPPLGDMGLQESGLSGSCLPSCLGCGGLGFLCTLVAGSDSGLGRTLGKVLPRTLRWLCRPLVPAAIEALQAAGPGTRVEAHLQGPAQGWRPPGQTRRSLWPLASPPPLGAAGIAASGTRSCSGMGLSWPRSWGCLLLSPDSPPSKLRNRTLAGREALVSFSLLRDKDSGGRGRPGTKPTLKLWAGD